MAAELLALAARSKDGWRGVLLRPCTDAAQEWSCGCGPPHGSFREAQACATRERSNRMNDNPGAAPMEVFLRTQDGRRVACGLERDEALDRPGVTYWKAVPQEPVELGTYDVEVVCPDGTRGLPPHTGFHVEAPKIGPGLNEIGTPADAPPQEDPQ